MSQKTTFFVFGIAAAMLTDAAFDFRHKVKFTWEAENTLGRVSQINRDFQQSGRGSVGFTIRTPGGTSTCFLDLKEGLPYREKVMMVCLPAMEGTRSTLGN